jgi:hypothetical protein
VAAAAQKPYTGLAPSLTAALGERRLQIEPWGARCRRAPVRSHVHVATVKLRLSRVPEELENG